MINLIFWFIVFFVWYLFFLFFYIFVTIDIFGPLADNIFLLIFISILQKFLIKTYNQTFIIFV